MLNEGRFLRFLLFLPRMFPSTFDTLFTPSFLRIGRARSNCTDLASRNSVWKANETPVKLSAAATS